ncbi:unnamed protein product [Parnassius apollo]|uniref:(apollo) hypothetical protein n=1 Tax=Parnassius apollo TaxID=110799 RepID=A0A8S3XQ90_PARAO|nr:unnamed protein product [Parnassius apollo]
MWPFLNQNHEQEDEWNPEHELPLAELKQMFQNQQTELTEHDLQGCFAENSDSQPIITDQKIINDAVSSPEQEDHYVKVTFLSPTKSSVRTEDALTAIDISIRWAEENKASDKS